MGGWGGGGHCDPRFTDMRPEASVRVRIVHGDSRDSCSVGLGHFWSSCHTCLRLVKRHLLRGGIITRMKRNRHSLRYFISASWAWHRPRLLQQEMSLLHHILSEKEKNPHLSQRIAGRRLNGNVRKQGGSQAQWLPPMTQAFGRQRNRTGTEGMELGTSYNRQHCEGCKPCQVCCIICEAQACHVMQVSRFKKWCACTCVCMYLCACQCAHMCA